MKRRNIKSGWWLNADGHCNPSFIDLKSLIAFCGNFQICGMPSFSILFWFIGENAIRYLLCVCDLVVENAFTVCKKCKYFMTRGIRIHRLQFLILNLKSWSENSHFSQIVFFYSSMKTFFFIHKVFFFLWFTRLIAPNSFAS